MKVYFYKAYGPFVGADTTGIVEAENEQQAIDTVYDIAVENYHSYAHDEDEDVEPEYDYYVEEYNSEEHDGELFESDIQLAQKLLALNPHQA